MSERIAFGKYLEQGIDVATRMEESRTKLAALTESWEDVSAKLRIIWAPDKIATLTTLVSLDQTPGEMLPRVLSLVPPERKIYTFDLEEYTTSLSWPIRPALWARIRSHAGEVENGLIIVKGFEKYNLYYDSLLFGLVNGVDSYDASPSVLVLPDLDFMAYLIATTLSNKVGYEGRGFIFVVKVGPPEEATS